MKSNENFISKEQISKKNLIKYEMMMIKKDIIIHSSEHSNKLIFHFFLMFEIIFHWFSKYFPTVFKVFLISFPLFSFSSLFLFNSFFLNLFWRNIKRFCHIVTSPLLKKCQDLISCKNNSKSREWKERPIELFYQKFIK